MLCRHVRTVSAVVLAAAGLAATAPPSAAVKPFSVYHDGDDLIFTPERAGTRKMASIGPWNLGERVGSEKPLDDKRLNLYLVVPGVQYRAPGKSEYDHNRVVKPSADRTCSLSTPELEHRGGYVISYRAKRLR